MENSGQLLMLLTDWISALHLSGQPLHHLCHLAWHEIETLARYTWIQPVDRMKVDRQ